MANFQPGTNFNWASTVAHYQIMAYRKSMARERLVFTDDVFHVIDDREGDADQRTEHAIAAALLRKIIQGQSGLYEFATRMACR